MYPPGTRIERSVIDDYVLGDTGVKLKKGDLVAIPVYAMHHDPQYFPDPFTFNPERFSEENVGSIQPYTYLPFGAGPRNCIGMRFALQVIKLSVLYTIRNVQLVRTEKTKGVPHVDSDNSRVVIVKTKGEYLCLNAPCSYDLRKEGRKEGRTIETMGDE
ncbi:hypothetical protein HPB48_025986 [Haemaphysalis longicornis]|uniref:Cytochrome P450 n=1 Tax=Haemaphysalis longicornis TaxID=44386 RepID=A0A9J6H8H4_HAELO|nr:hypothetical protein HPB48_025986 [Haemaphysalis longicornis]